MCLHFENEQSFKMNDFRKSKLALDDVQGMVKEALTLDETLKKAVDATLKWDATSITLAQIKYELEQIEKSLDDLLKADFESAKKRFGDAMIYIR